MSVESQVMSLTPEEARRLAEALRNGSSARLAGALDRAAATGERVVVGVTNVSPPGERLEALIEAMTPDVRFPSEAAAVLSQRNARRRAELLEEFGALTGDDIAQERSRARNRHALAARWRKEGRVFGVPYRGQTLHPGFQFDDERRLRPVIRQVLAALPRDHMSAWEVALWWTAGNGHLGGRRPVDLLDEQPEALPEAAAALAAPARL